MNFTKITHPPNNKLPVFNLEKEQLASLHKYKDRDILFFPFSECTEYLEQVDGKYYAPFTDSMIDFVRNTYSYLKVEIISNKALETQPRLEPTIFINPPLVCHRADGINSIEGFLGLQEVIFKASGIQVDESLFLEQARLVSAWQGYFTEILSATRPKSVFVVCYYHFAAMAIISACKSLGITTVDIQHGAYGDYHDFYTHWTKIPTDGYDLLPDYFWCWGQTSKNSAERWHSPGNPPPRPIIGGNLRVAQWIKGDDLIINDDMRNFYKLLEKKDKVILVTAGRPSLLPLGKHVIDAMHDSSDNWLWLIRLHPAHRSKEEKTQMTAILEQGGVTNYEIEYASSCPLYSLLKRCNHHVTVLSSTFYEAMAFGVPVTIIDQAGFECCEDDINKGIITYADTSEALLGLIQENTSHSQLTASKAYIQTDKQCAHNAIKTILNHSIRSPKNDVPADCKIQAVAVDDKLSYEKKIRKDFDVQPTIRKYCGRRPREHYDVNDGQNLLEQARKTFQKGSFNEAFDIYEQLSLAYPNNAVEILAEVYDQYQLLPGQDRYTLYQSRIYDFGIGPEDKVLDIGSGHSPFPHATHLADIALTNNSYGRAGAPFKYIDGKPVFECDVENLLFRDKEFDFVYCSHVLEHTINPEKACNELMRIAKRGYIETPTFAKEIWLNSAKISNHKWGIENINNKLIFFEYTHKEIEGLGNSILLNMHCSPQTAREKAFSALIYLKANVINTMLLWEDSFKYEVHHLNQQANYLQSQNRFENKKPLKRENSQKHGTTTPRKLFKVSEVRSFKEISL